MKKSLKRKIILSMIACALIPTLLASGTYLLKKENELKTSIQKDNAIVAEEIANNLEQIMITAQRLSNWTVFNHDINELYFLPEGKLNESYYAVYQNAKQALQDFVMMNGLEKHIEFLVLGRNDGTNLSYGRNTHLLDVEKLKKEPWFTEYLQGSGSVYLTGAEDNPTQYSAQKKIFPLLRKVVDGEGRERGFSLIAFNNTLVENIFKPSYESPYNSYFVLDAEMQPVLSSEAQGATPEELAEIQAIGRIINDSPKGFIGDFSTDDYFYTYNVCDFSGWTVIVKTSGEIFGKELYAFYNTTALTLFFLLLASVVVSLLLSRLLTQPIQRILRRIDIISTGDFSQDVCIEDSDEIGQIGHGINNMVRRISQLMKINEEHNNEKRRLEFAMLQSQINPHFLYNTLNSIRWLAYISNNSTIADAVSSLATLLKSSFGNLSVCHTVEKELEDLQAYCYIQNLRYADKVKVQFQLMGDQEKISTCEVLKLIIQPLIENSFFHGIEAKKGTGNITVTFSLQGEWLQIAVKDDGVGMTAEQIKAVLHEERDNGKNFMYRHIGLYNIDKRLRLEYGESSGLRIESEQQRYTQVSFNIPAKTERGNNGI